MNRSRIYVLYIILIFSILEFTQSYKFKFTNSYKYNRKRSVNLNLIDQIQSSVDAVPQIQNSFDVFTANFNDAFAGFSGRLVGGFLANIIIGISIKVISDAIFKKNNNRVMNKQPIIDTKPKIEIPVNAWFTLLICIAIDLTGDSSFLLPGVGEVEDAVWAPFSAFLLNNLFGSNVITTIDFAKEILPFTDFIPVATLSWVLKFVYPESPLTNLLGIKNEISEESVDNKESKKTEKK